MPKSPPLFQIQWTFGHYILYTRSRFLARQAYEELCKMEPCDERTGTLHLESGDRVDWIDLNHGHGDIPSPHSDEL